ncbi:xanthine permease, partial [Hungatella hathewayi DSM 13479]
MKETADGGALTCGREQNADSLAEDGKNIEIKRMIKENIMKSNAEISINNIYRLDGRVPLGKAIPFGLQHVLAMFVANLTPIVIVTAAAGLETSQTAALIQNAMFIAGVATLIQLYPVWRIGAKLPIVMGVSFTFVTILSSVGAKYGYPAILGAILIGGLVEGTLGLFAKYWRKLISPIVSACVVTSIGFSLLTVGARSFGGGYSDSFGSATNLLIGTVTLLSCILFNVFAKSFWKQLSVLFGLVVGYVLSIFLGVVDLSGLLDGGILSLPRILPFMPEFHAGAILSVVVIFLVSATETIGDTTAMVASGLDRDITEKEISGSLACDGFASSISSLFGCLPVTSFSQNVGLIAMTKVVNRFTIMTGAFCMILSGLFPPIGAFFASLPDAVLGGCTIMMFGSIIISGVQMLARAGFSQRNTIIGSLSLSVGIGFTLLPEIFQIFPSIIQDVFAENCVAVVFVLAILLNLILPENMDIEKAVEA